jgi:hypothetical protein
MLQRGARGFCKNVQRAKSCTLEFIEMIEIHGANLPVVCFLFCLQPSAQWLTVFTQNSEAAPNTLMQIDN